jgi:hypothetical protein
MSSALLVSATHPGGLFAAILAATTSLALPCRANAAELPPPPAPATQPPRASTPEPRRPPPPPSPAQSPDPAPSLLLSLPPPELAHGPRSRAKVPLRTGLAVGLVVSHAVAIGLDLGTARAVGVVCPRPANLPAINGTCDRGEGLGLGIGAMVFHISSFTMAAGLGYVQGEIRALERPAPAARPLRAAAWFGGLLVTAGVLGTALSGLATQQADDARQATATSLLRGAATVTASIGVGLLTWREGIRRVRPGLALGPGRASVSLSLVF